MSNKNYKTQIDNAFIKATEGEHVSLRPKQFNQAQGYIALLLLFLEEEGHNPVVWINYGSSYMKLYFESGGSMNIQMAEESIKRREKLFELTNGSDGVFRGKRALLWETSGTPFQYLSSNSVIKFPKYNKPLDFWHKFTADWKCKLV